MEVIAVYARERLKAHLAPDLISLLFGQASRRVLGRRSGLCDQEAEVRCLCRPGAARWASRRQPLGTNLKNLRAMINHYHETYGLKTVPIVTLPPKGDARVSDG